jgi:hypothetical protein
MLTLGATVDAIPFGSWAVLRSSLPIAVFAGFVTIGLAWTDRLFELQNRLREGLWCEVVIGLAAVAFSLVAMFSETASLAAMVVLAVLGAGYVWRGYRATRRLPGRIGPSFVRSVLLIATAAGFAAAVGVFLADALVNSSKSDVN